MTIGSAERLYLEGTAASSRPLMTKASGVRLDFRERGRAVAWVEFGSCAMSLLKIEALDNQAGAATEMLTFLKAIADQTGVMIVGNVASYQTPERGNDDHDITRLVAWYENHGFKVGPGPIRELRYSRPQDGSNI